MIRIRWAAGVAAVAASALGGCRPAAAPAPETPKPPPTAQLAGAPQFGAITAVCPVLPDRIPVVRIQITDVSPKRLGHVTTLLYESAKGGADRASEPPKTIPEVVFKGQNPTRLDFDAAAYLTKPGDVLAVDVDLADPAASFVEGPAAITAGNDDGAAMFCIKAGTSGINPRASDRTARFYVRYLESKTPRYGKYNIFLLLRDGPFLTPTVLDPKIHDSG